MTWLPICITFIVNQLVGADLLLSDGRELSAGERLNIQGRLLLLHQHLHDCQRNNTTFKIGTTFSIICSLWHHFLQFCLLACLAFHKSDAIASQDLHPERTIYVHGCMTVLTRRLRRDVLPLLLTYIGCAVLLALLQILSLVLARLVGDHNFGGRQLERFKQSPVFSAYAAAISRKNKRPESQASQYAQPFLPQAKPGEKKKNLEKWNNFPRPHLLGHAVQWNSRQWESDQQYSQQQPLAEVVGVSK